MTLLEANENNAENSSGDGFTRSEESSGFSAFNLAPSMEKGARLNRKVVAVALAFICLLMIFSLLNAFVPKSPKAQKKDEEKKEEVAKKVTAPEDLTNAPKSYEDVEAFLRSQIQEGAKAKKKKEKIDFIEPEPMPQTVVAAPQEPIDAEEMRERHRSPIFFKKFDQKNAPKAQPAYEVSVNESKLQAAVDKIKNANKSSGVAGFGGGGSGKQKTSNKEQVDPSYVQGMQDQKANFLNKASGGSKIYLEEQLQSPVSPFELAAGSILPAVLITGINTDLPGQIIGQIRENVYDTVGGNFLLVPQGTKLLGQYDSVVAYGQNRVLIAWDYLIFPNGKSISLRGMQGADLSGFIGVKDKVNNHRAAIFGSVILSTLFSVGVTASEGNAEGENPSNSQLFASGVTSNVGDVASKILDKALNRQPTLTVRPGYMLNILVNKTLVLEPYQFHIEKDEESHANNPF